MKRFEALMAVAAYLLVFTSCRPTVEPAGSQETTALVPATLLVTDSAAVSSRSFELLSRNGECVLRTGSVNHPLAPKAPCYFVRSPGKETAWSIEYSDVKTTATLIVIGTPVSESARKTWNLLPNVVCGGEAQGVLVRDGAVFVTKSVRKGGIYCRDMGIDEKEFYSFAHEKR